MYFGKGLSKAWKSHLGMYSDLNLNSLSFDFGQYRTSKLSVISKTEFTQNSTYPFSGHLLNLTKRNYVIP